jgi:2-polyprenyl-3-methyl-5-hydroxy-6-metoxy-1,4-benzoquinol methylase
MFGSTIDYWILRPLTHNRKLESEEELDARFSHSSMIDMAAAIRRVLKLQSRLQGRFPIQPDLRYLDIGCGTGDITLALAKLGAGKVTGLDFLPRYISAAVANSERVQLGDRVEFVCCDVHDWTPPHRYDVVISHEALEHIRDPKGLLARLSALVESKGIAVLAFGPLFPSPFGDHMGGFFRVPVPWRGVLFSEEAVLRLRRMQYRPTDPAASYPEIAGGLNLLRYSEFLRHVAETGWEFDFLAVNPQLARVPPLYWMSNALVRTPLVRDYVASSVYTILRRAEVPSHVRT